MTISTTTRSVTYNGNGVAKDFAYPFKIAAAEDLRVYLKQGATYVLQSLGTDYSVSGVGAAGGGVVSFVVAPGVGTANVRILRRTALTQLADYVTNDAFPAEIHEAALDKLTMALQDRADEALATDESGAYWDAKGLPIRNAGIPESDSDLVTKGFADGLYGGAAAQQAAASAVSAASAASAAATSATSAATSATSAATSAASAAASAASIALPLAITSGGTGATSAAAARTALGATAAGSAIFTAADAAAQRAALGAGTANGLATLDSGGKVPTAQLPSLGSGRLLRITRYATPGHGTWARPSDTVSVLIRAVGGGGGGGGNSGSGSGGGGGGAGGYSEIYIAPAASSYAYTVGAGGAGGTSGTGGTGGTTAIHTLWVDGGAGGLLSGGAGGFGGSGGTASGGNLNIRGSDGAAAFAGGGSGGASIFGGNGMSGTNVTPPTAGVFGSGGGGSRGSQNGGAGGAGYIEIWEFS